MTRLSEQGISPLSDVIFDQGAEETFLVPDVPVVDGLKIDAWDIPVFLFDGTDLEPHGIKQHPA